MSQMLEQILTHPIDGYSLILIGLGLMSWSVAQFLDEARVRASRKPVRIRDDWRDDV